MAAKSGQTEPRSGAAAQGREAGLRRELAALSFTGMGELHHNLPESELIARSLARNEGVLAANGALVVHTGPRTGRSPDDRFIVDVPSVHENVDWGSVNHPCSRRDFDRMLRKASAFLRHREAYVFDGVAGADPHHRLPVRVVAEATWHALFARTLFLRPALHEPHDQSEPGLTVIACGALMAAPKGDGARPAAFIGIDLERRLALIVGSMYAGEIKKSVFSMLNFLLPERGVLPMHCSANAGRAGDVALFFGLSGTGKTTLSADPRRRLIGDDEHGWSDQGVFNFEGGCYAKVISLSAHAEPQIFQAIRFGSILENVVVDPWTRAVAYDDASLTENTRATYPVSHIKGHVASGTGGHPRNVFFLTCDAHGVLPPIAKLTPDMATYHFLSGFTARLAGTESGVDEPVPTFSSCFGAPFMPRHATVYARLLAERLTRHHTACWLVNTGWSGGPYGVGRRMRIEVTRRLLTAALDGDLDHVAFHTDPFLRVLVPEGCPGVPDELLSPRETWSDPAAYDDHARALAAQLAENFRQYVGLVPSSVASAGPSP